MKKSILIGLSLFTAYNLWLWMAKPWHEKTEYPYWVLENYGKAQKYKEVSIQPEWVLCGSSLSAVLVPWLPDSVYDLSMTGGSYLTGMEIISVSGKVPPVVGIEINMILRLEDVYITNDLFHPVMDPLRNYIPALTAYNQPLSYFASGLLAKQDLDLKRKKLKDQVFRGDDVLNKTLPEKQLEYSTAYDSAATEEMITYIGELIQKYKSAGAKVFLYEMPQDQSLMNSVRFIDLRNKIRRLPCPFIAAPIYHNWETTDGEHLIPSEAFAFTNWLIRRNIFTTDSVHD